MIKKSKRLYSKKVHVKYQEQFQLCMHVCVQVMKNIFDTAINGMVSERNFKENVA